MPKSIISTRPDKPKKPKDFPLTPHPSGRWCKKVLGRLHYFGKWDDPQGALNRWLDDKDDLLAGKTPRRLSTVVTLRELVNEFLTFKQGKLDNGELSPTTATTYYQTCEKLIDHFGKHHRIDDFRPEDFTTYRVKLANRLGLVSLKNEITRVRSLFKFALEMGRLEKPIRFGPGFSQPRKENIDKERNRKEKKLFTQDEIKKLLAAASPALRAMILLACNAGLGNSDLACLPLSAVDLMTGWVDFPRPKNGKERRFPLWAETSNALEEVIANRPQAKQEEHQGLLFLTRCGAPWCKAVFKPSEAQDEKPIFYNDDSITKEFKKLMKEAGFPKRKGIGFYTIRHLYETVAGDSRDQVATDYIMGHCDPSMAGIYREGVFDHRLEAVVKHVHAWLFGSAKKK